MNSAHILTDAIRNISQNLIIKQVELMLNHFKTYNFIAANKNRSLYLDFHSENLKLLVKNEWLSTNIVLSEQPAFYFSSLQGESQLKNAFVNVRNMVSQLPFSLVEISTGIKDKESKETDFNNAIDIVRNSFKMENKTIMKNLTFCSPQEAVAFFHKQQRERKIWWRKFSALPGRFLTTEINNDATHQCQFVEIKAEFLWGIETVEKITYLPEVPASDIDFFEMSTKRKKFVPHVISCETALEVASFTYLCDAFEILNEDSDRDVLRFCKKLAPYKVSFVVNGTSSETLQNLRELALLLAKKLRQCGISVLLLPDIFSGSVERQVLRNDALGVLYTILLNETTLKDGVILIRSRDTTLKEESHVSLVVSYIEKLMKNY